MVMMIRPRCPRSYHGACSCRRTSHVHRNVLSGHAAWFPSVTSMDVIRLCSSPKRFRVSIANCARSRMTVADTLTRSVWWGPCRMADDWSMIPLTQTSCMARSGPPSWPIHPAATPSLCHSALRLRFHGRKTSSGRYITLQWSYL